MTCAGTVSWCGFARAIFQRAPELLGGKIADGESDQDPASIPTPAKRPLQLRAVESKSSMTRFGVRLAPWESALDIVLSTIAAQPSQA